MYNALTTRTEVPLPAFSLLFLVFGLRIRSSLALCAERRANSVVRFKYYQFSSKPHFMWIFFNREFSSQPHIAGGPRQLDLANKLTALWTKFGLDKVEKPEYRVLLSYPQHNKPNRVTLMENGEAIYNITGKIKVREIQTFLQLWCRNYRCIISTHGQLLLGTGLVYTSRYYVFLNKQTRKQTNESKWSNFGIQGKK